GSGSSSGKGATSAPLQQTVSAQQVAINFDDLSDGTVVTKQYASARFSSSAGNVNYVTAQSAYNGSKPNFLCTGPAGAAISCTADTIVDFTAPVSRLTFNGMGINNNGTVADIDVYSALGLVATVAVIGHSSGLNPELQSLAGYNAVTRIRIYNI